MAHHRSRLDSLPRRGGDATFSVTWRSPLSTRGQPHPVGLGRSWRTLSNEASSFLRRRLVKDDNGGNYMTKKPRRRGGHANPTPWRDAIREVPAAWLEDEAQKSSSPSSLLSSWKGGRGGVPAHIMLSMLRRRVRERYPGLQRALPPAAELHRAQDIVRNIWTQTGPAGRSNPTWRLVMGVLRMAWQQMVVVQGTPENNRAIKTERSARSDSPSEK